MRGELGLRRLAATEGRHVAGLPAEVAGPRSPKRELTPGERTTIPHVRRLGIRGVVSGGFRQVIDRWEHELMLDFVAPTSSRSSRQAHRAGRRATIVDRAGKAKR